MDRTTRTAVFASALLLAFAASAEEPKKEPGAAPAQAEAAKPAQECVQAWELMTEAEFAEHRGRMQAAKTREERDRIRAEHHAQMTKRAAERGVTLREAGACGCPGAGSGAMGMGHAGMGHASGVGCECPMCAECAAAANTPPAPSAEKAPDAAHDPDADR